MPQLSVGMVSNEIIHADASRTGGFGYGTRVLIGTLTSAGRASVRYLTAHEQFEKGFGTRERMASDRSYFRRRSIPDLLRLKVARLDMLALLDYRTQYQYFLNHRPRLPVLIWARDPRSQADNERFISLREPGFPDALPAQATPPRTETLRQYVLPEGGPARPHVFAVSTPHLRSKLSEAYHMPVTGEVPWLCTVIPTVDRPAPESETPTVVSLARLDPQKRPWLVFELARRMPDVRFVMAGRTHAELRWQPTRVPDNLVLAGEVKGEEKERLLDDAWMLVNTAIHEALPVSWLEALGHARPVVSCLDLEDVPSRFGRVVPFAGGVGMEMLPDFEEAIRSLLDDAVDRRARGLAGLEYIRENHNAEHFLQGWDRIVELLGLQHPAGRSR